MPLPLAGAFRQASALLQPPVAAGLAAAGAGIALGTWLAGTTPAASGTNVATEPYEFSSLFADGPGGLADAYLSDDVAQPVPGVAPVESSTTAPGAAGPSGPAPADSGGEPR
jgi:hypothetical protein